MRPITTMSIALAAACALVVVLGVQNRRLKADYAALQTASLAPEVGSWLPSLELRALDGRNEILGGAGQPQIIYFFDTGCPACTVSAVSVRNIATMLQADISAKVQIVGVGSGDGLQAYLKEKEFDFPVFQQSGKLISLFDVRQVPLLLAVDREGRVFYSHVGAIEDTEVVPTLMTALSALEGADNGPIQGKGK